MANIGDITFQFLYVINQMKIYHWQTKVYARHIASDTLIQSLLEKTDKFLETMQGSENKRILLNSKNSSIQLKNESDTSILKVLKSFKEWLEYKLPGYLTEENSDLMNIRDDILGDVNKTIYLFTFQ
jgi:hypothetical protein